MIKRELNIFENNKKAIKVIKSLFRYRVAVRKNKNMDAKARNRMLVVIKHNIEDFQNHRKDMIAKEQEIPTEDHLGKLNQKITFDFDKILNDARALKKTMTEIN
jgi:hypothetical protein